VCNKLHVNWAYIAQAGLNPQHGIVARILSNLFQQLTTVLYFSMVDDVPLCFTSIILRSVVSFSDVCLMKKKLIYFNTIGSSTPEYFDPWVWSSHAFCFWRVSCYYGMIIQMIVNICFKKKWQYAKSITQLALYFHKPYFYLRFLFSSGRKMQFWHHFTFCNFILRLVGVCCSKRKRYTYTNFLTTQVGE